MLLGVLLVSYSSRGHQLVFSYPEIKDSQFLGFDPKFLADILSPKDALCDQKFHLRVDQFDFLGHPALLNADRKKSGLRYAREAQETISKISKLSLLTMFHLVFVMGNCEKDEIDLCYEHCMMKLTAGLKFEQLRRGYIRSQTELILKLREESKRFEEIVLQSCLAKTIVDIYRAMKGEIPPHIVISDSVRLSIQPDLGVLRSLDKPIALGSHDTTGFPVLRPYKALLLMEDPVQILERLPIGSSPALIQLIQSLSPATTFEQLQTRLNMPLSQIYKFSSHLHFWGQAKVIQAISTRNFYVVSADANFSDIGRFNSEFSSRFPAIDLVSMLKSISIPMPFHSVIPSRDVKVMYLEAIAFLLRKGIVKQLYMTLILLIPKGALQMVTKSPVTNDLVISNPCNMTELEKKCVAYIKSNQHNPAVLRLFERMLPHMNGITSLDEIMFQEKVGKKELKLILSHFRENVITSLN